MRKLGPFTLTLGKWRELGSLRVPGWPWLHNDLGYIMRACQQTEKTNKTDKSKTQKSKNKGTEF